MPQIDQLTLLERKVYDGRKPSKKPALPHIDSIITEAPCFSCQKSTEDFCNPETCQKLTDWLQEDQ